MRSSNNALGCVTIIGFPSSGKSTVGRALAKRLGYTFIDGDDVIREQMGKSLPQIMDEEGPAGFIKVEERVLSGLDVQDAVIAPGGSVAYEPAAMAHLASLGPIVYLEFSFDDLCARVGDLHDRGVVLKNGMGMSLQELWDERLPLYEQYAQITVSTHGVSVAKTVEAAMTALKKYQEGSKA